METMWVDVTVEMFKGTTYRGVRAVDWAVACGF